MHQHGTDRPVVADVSPVFADSGAETISSFIKICFTASDARYVIYSTVKVICVAFCLVLCHIFSQDVLTIFTVLP